MHIHVNLARIWNILSYCKFPKNSTYPCNWNPIHLQENNFPHCSPLHKDHPPHHKHPHNCLEVQEERCSLEEHSNHERNPTRRNVLMMLKNNIKNKCLNNAHKQHHLAEKAYQCSSGVKVSFDNTEQYIVNFLLRPQVTQAHYLCHVQVSYNILLWPTCARDKHY